MYVGGKKEQKLKRRGGKKPDRKKNLFSKYREDLYP